MKKKKQRRRMPSLPRVPLPRQTEKVMPARRGGKYDRNQSRREARRELKNEGWR